MTNQNGNTAIVQYETDHGVVQLSPDIIRKYLVSGDPSKVTHQEVQMFLQLNKFQRLNPFLKESYLIKYSEKEPATMVVGKEVFTKRAAASELCGGWDAGIIVQTSKGKLEYREGTLKLPDDTLIGGWANVYRKDWSTPAKAAVMLDEYIRYNKSGEPMANWKKMPSTMIRKVALVQALREAFPEDLGGMVSMEEMPVDDTMLDSEPVKAEVIDVTPKEQKREPQDTKEEPKINPKQVKDMYAKAEGHNDIGKSVMAQFGYERAKEVLVKDYDKICEEIDRLVKERKEELAKEEQQEQDSKGTLTPEQEEELSKELEQDGLFD